MKTRRTFKKSKHRKKRSYHKKVSISYLRLAKSTILGIIPLIIICIGLTTTILINSRVLDRYNNLQIHIPLPNYTLPNFSIPNVVPITNNLLQKMFRITSSIRITAPKITLPTIKISLPQVDITAFLQQSLQQLISFCTLFNPLPLLQSIERWILRTLSAEANIFTENTMQTFTILETILLTIVTTIQQTLTGIYWIVTILTIAIIHFIQNTVMLIQSLGNSSVQQVHIAINLIGKTISDTYIFCINELKNFLSFLWQEIKLLANIIWRIITIPFIAIQKEIQTISPYVKVITTLLAKPINEFIQSINNLASLVASVSKHGSN